MKGYLPESEWRMFIELFEKVEGTTYHDTQRLALMLLEKLDVPLGQAASRNNESITTLIHLALKKIP